MNGAVASSAGGVEHERPVRIDPRLDMRARLPLVHPRRQAHPDADADIDMNEAFRSAEFGDADFAGKVEAWRLPVADGYGVGPKAEPIDAVRQSRQRPDQRKIAAAFQCDDRAALLDDELIQGRIGKDPRGFDVFRPSIDAGGRSDLSGPALVQGDGRSAEQQRFRRLGRRVDQDGAGLGEYARQFLA